MEAKMPGAILSPEEAEVEPTLDPDEEAEQSAIYWSLIHDRRVPRGVQGDFHLAQGQVVLEVARPVRIRFGHWSGPRVWMAPAGALVLKANRPANKWERQYFASLGGGELDYVTIGRLFDGPDALNDALRSTLRHTLRSIGGRREKIREGWIMIPGKVQQVIDELEKEDLKAQYRGVLRKARELRRIQIKIEGGFESACNTLLRVYRGLKEDRISVLVATIRLAGLWPYLDRVASVNPYWPWVHKRRPVVALQNIREIIDKDRLLRVILRAHAALEKGWRGTVVRPAEIARAGRRYRRSQ